MSHSTSLRRWQSGILDEAPIAKKKKAQKGKTSGHNGTGANSPDTASYSPLETETHAAWDSKNIDQQEKTVDL